VNDRETADVARPHPASPRPRVGPYEIVRELGSGGMGSVYLARRADEQFEKEVALKIVRGGVAAEADRQLFRRERQILAGLEHPHIARLLDGGTTEDGVPYLVMEYVVGEPIDRYCASRGLSVPERLGLFRSVCGAVGYAHRQLVVHRDLKPANVLVTADGQPKLLDFGIAKLLDPEAATPVTTLALTSWYASPEQVRHQPITTASDVYSLGVVLYELLAQDSPYRVTTGLQRDILRAVCEDDPAPPSEAAARARPTRQDLRETATADLAAEPPPATPERQRLQRALRGDLDTITLKALRKDPAERYLSAEALSDDVGRYLAGLPVHARAQSIPYRLAKFVRRHRVAAVAGALGLALVAAFVTALVVQSRRLARERDRAEQARDRSQRVLGFVLDMFEVADPERARGRELSAKDVLQHGADRAASAFRDDPETRAALLDTIGRVHTSLGDSERAAPLLEEVVAIRRRTPGDRLDTAAALSQLAEARGELGDLEAAERLFREALAMRQRLLPPDHPDVGAALSDLGSMLADQGALDEAETYERQGLAVLRGHPESDALARVLTNLGFLRYQRMDYAQAEALFREALEVQTRVSGADHPLSLTTLNNLANAVSQQARFSDAEALFRRTVDDGRRILGDDHPDVARYLKNLGVNLLEQDRDAEAVGYLRDALARREKQLEPGHGDLARGRASLASALVRVDPAEAAAVARDGLAPGEAILPAVRGDLHVALAEALLARGYFREAETEARRGLALRTAAQPAGHWTIDDARSVLGAVLLREGRRAEAEPLLRDAAAALAEARGERMRVTRLARERSAQLDRAVRETG
jgi:serine/threonine protein kinase